MSSFFLTGFPPIVFVPPSRQIDSGSHHHFHHPLDVTQYATHLKCVISSYRTLERERKDEKVASRSRNYATLCNLNVAHVSIFECFAMFLMLARSGFVVLCTTPSINVVIGQMNEFLASPNHVMPRNAIERDHERHVEMRVHRAAVLEILGKLEYAP